jgi:hypothetical protein
VCTKERAKRVTNRWPLSRGNKHLTSVMNKKCFNSIDYLTILLPINRAWFSIIQDMPFVIHCLSEEKGSHYTRHIQSLFPFHIFGTD